VIKKSARLTVSGAAPSSTAFRGKLQRIILVLEVTRIGLPPHGCRSQRRKGTLLEAHRVKLALGRKPQDAARKLVGPDPIVAAELQRQPGFLECRVQERQRLGSPCGG